MTSNTENMPPPRSGRSLFFEQMLRTFSTNKLTGLGAAIFILVVLVAIFAPLLKKPPWDSNPLEGFSRSLQDVPFHSESSESGVEDQREIYIFIYILF